MMAIEAGRHLAESAFRFEEASEQYTKAIAAFDWALARDPTDANSHVHRSGALFAWARRSSASAAGTRP